MLIESFLDYLRLERNYSDKTILAYRKDVDQFAEFIQEQMFVSSLVDVTSELIREWIVSLMDKGYTSASINRKLSTLRSFYKYLLRKRLVEINPLLKVVAPKKRKSLPVFVKESDMDKLLDEVDFGKGFKACRDKLIIELFYATGMRLSELVELNDEDVDFARSVIKVTGKRNKQRLIPFDEPLKEDIREYIDNRDAKVQRKSLALFVKEDGERIYNGLIYKLVRRNLSKVVTLKKRSPHVLRHSFATAMLNNEAELGAVKEILGHSSLAATEIYTHTTFEELKKVYKQAHPRA